MAEEKPGRWRIHRVMTDHGDEFWWELVAWDGTVLERIAVEKARGAADDEKKPPDA